MTLRFPRASGASSATIVACLTFVTSLALADQLDPNALEGHTPVLTKAPVLLKRVEAVFPEEAQKLKLTGDVTMQIDIGADGHVVNAVVTEGAGHGFDEAALAAIKQFVFSPAEIDNVPAPVRIAYKQHFIYKPPPPPPVEAPAAKVPTVTVTGRILERFTRKPLLGAAVIVAPGGEVVETDKDGRFELHPAPGDLALTVTEPSHQKFETTEKLKPNEVLKVTYYLLSNTYGEFEGVVQGTREAKEVTRITLTREELQNIPGSMDDPLRVLQDLPGVARVPLVSGALIVRGSAPTDTQVEVEGMDLPLLYHLLGGPSVVNGEFVDHLDFYPGGFGSEYGRAIGGIVDVTARDPKDNQVHGSASVSVFDAELFLTAPVPWIPGLTISAAGRRSYYDLVLPPLLKAAGESTLFVVPIYDDYQVKIDYAPPNSHNKFDLFLMGSNDILDVVETGTATKSGFSLDDTMAFWRLQAAWRYHFDNFSNKLQLYIGQNNDVTSVGTFNDTETVFVLGLREKLEWEFVPQWKLRVGLDIQEGLGGYSVIQAPNRSTYPSFPGSSSEGTLETRQVGYNEGDYGEWLELQAGLPGGLKIIPGVRADEFRISDRWLPSLDPRIIVREEFKILGEPAAVKASVGLYHETPQAALFDPTTGNPNLGLQGAWQYSAGAESKIIGGLSVDVTGFYNKRFDLAEGSTATVTNSAGITSPLHYQSSGNGQAYGMEVLLRQAITKHFFGWVAYTLSWSQEQTAPGQPWNPAAYDERHILTIIAQYKFGNGWELGARFRVATGVPETLPAGATFNSDTEGYREIVGTVGGAREPTFNQLDLRVDKEWVMNVWAIGIYLDIQNVYNAQNQEAVIYDYRYQTTEVVPGLPFLPTLGVKGRF